METEDESSQEDPDSQNEVSEIVPSANTSEPELSKESWTPINADDHTSENTQSQSEEKSSYEDKDLSVDQCETKRQRKVTTKV